MAPKKKARVSIGEGEIPVVAPPEKSTRRTSVQLRKEHAGVGAMFLRIIWDSVAWVVPGFADVPAGEKTVAFNKYDGRDPKKREQQYRTCERKGYRVSKDTGCFAPHPQYATKGKGGSEKGYQLAFFAKHGFVPKQHGKGDTVTDPATGKDISWQLSHLCHCRWCCRLDHLCIEQRWRNLMRNFCLGPLKKFRLPDGKVIDTCGCSLQFHACGKPDLAGPSCIAPYAISPEAPPADLNTCMTTGEVDDVLRKTNFPLRYQHVVHTDRDKASAMRMQRASNNNADKKALKEAVRTLSPPTKNMTKKRDFTVAFSDEQVENPTNTIVVVSDESDFE